MASPRCRGGIKVASVEVTQENLHQIISGNNMVIVDFWAPWCGPCRLFAPAYEAASEKYPDVVFAKVNTEEQQALAGYFQIRSIPTLMIFREKIIIFAQPGALPASALEQAIDKAKSLDMNEVRREIEKESANAPKSG
ncbi:MAG: thioredoxin [Sulfuricaulis sp.]|nr:thioredoxin [Sulfuricaulis sp.]